MSQWNFIVVRNIGCHIQVLMEKWTALIPYHGWPHTSFDDKKKKHQCASFVTAKSDSGKTLVAAPLPEGPGCQVMDAVSPVSALPSSTSNATKKKIPSLNPEPPPEYWASINHHLSPKFDPGEHAVEETDEVSFFSYSSFILFSFISCPSPLPLLPPPSPHTVTPLHASLSTCGLWGVITTHKLLRTRIP